jgi:heavy metal sensor kinase
LRLPIRLRLTAWYVALLAVVLAGVGAFAVERLRSDLEGDVDRSLAATAPQIAYGFQREGRSEFRDASTSLLPALPSGPAAAQVLDRKGRVLLKYGIALSAHPMLSGSMLAEALGGQRVKTTVSLGPKSESFRLLALPVQRKGHPRVVVVAKSLRGPEKSASRLLVLLLLALPAALVVTALGGWWLAKKALRPVERMTTQAEEIGVERLEERIPVPPTRDEVAHLAKTLNSMLERLQRGVNEKRRLVADASHELRTPLAAMQAELDVTLDYEELSPEARAVLISTREEVDRMAGLVANLLTLASIDEGRLSLQAERVDLSEVARAAVGGLEQVAAGAGVDLSVDGQGATAIGDEERLREVVVNLVENAIKFSEAGASVHVVTSHTEREAVMRVTDTGPGIPTDARERVFERFWRADQSRAYNGGGSGLGLSICQEIVKAHGGRIWVEGEEGEGACFCVALPSSEQRSGMSSP